MGTNFYWATVALSTFKLPTGEEVQIGPKVDSCDPILHIGKRSAAGLYCWDCNLTLQIGGLAELHYGRTGQHKACPKCHQEPVVESLNRSSGGVELGFAKPRDSRPWGVRSCSSFTWAQDPTVVRRICEERPGERLIVDEYDRHCTCAEFLTMLKCNCPIELLHLVGQWFC